MDRPIESSERRPSNNLEFKSERIKRIYVLVKSGAIFPTPRNPQTYLSVDVDTDKATSALEQLPTADQPNPRPASREEETSLEERSKKSFRQVVKAFVGEKIISPELAVQIGRIVRAEGVAKHKGNYHTFEYKLDHFPNQGEEKGQIKINIPLFQSRVELLKGYLQRAGAQFEDHEIEDICLIEDISHEYGHAVDKTLELLRFERGRQISPDFRFGAAIGEVKTIFAREAPLDRSVEEFLKDDIFDHLEIRHERIAQGFGYLGLGLKLRNLGLSQEQISRVIEQNKDVWNVSYEDNASMLNYIREKGMSMLDLMNGLTLLYNRLSERGLTDLAKLVPEWSIGNFGYAHPLEETQLKRFIELAQQS